MTRIWCITDGSAGMAAQARALAEALKMPYEMKNCSRRTPFVWLPNDLCGHALLQLTANSDSLSPPWPELVITCGRRSAPLGAALRRAGGGQVKAVHIQQPQMRLSAFDLVIAMEHDELAGPNVLTTHFAMHTITPAKLEAAALRWQQRFAHLPKPYTAVLFGGSTNKYALTDQRMQETLAQLQAFYARVGGSLLITPSRRTDDEHVTQMKEKLLGVGTYIYDGEGENPYFGLLALADRIVVSNDSVNMLSEAAATGKPLYVLPLAGHTGTKPARFAQMMLAEGIARGLEEELTAWTYAIPDEAARVAALVRSKLRLS